MRRCALTSELSSNRAPHPDAREASRLYSSSQSRRWVQTLGAAMEAAYMARTLSYVSMLARVFVNDGESHVK